MDWFASWYVPYIIRRNFSALRFHGERNGCSEPLLVLSNHAGWWDPFFIIYANLKFFHKRYHVMMLEKELKARPLLRQAGAYSVRKSSRDALVTLEYTVQLLRHERNLVEIFPQGRIESPLLDTMHFEKGVDLVLEKSPHCRVLFAACFTEYFSSRKPEAHVFLSWWNASAMGVASDFNQFYQDCRCRMIAMHKSSEP